MGRFGATAAAAGFPGKPSNYEHLVIEEQRREWERAKEELGHIKKQIAEKVSSTYHANAIATAPMGTLNCFAVFDVLRGQDDQIVHLKTLVRKLNETLQKKEKDLQAVFAVLRAPQDAELTKKRKNELIDRLVMGNQQRVVNAEAIADERKKELDRLKYSSKFLRFQELEVELEEYRVEIERLRAKMSTMMTSSTTPGVVVGKLKLSAVCDGDHQTRGDGNQRTKKKPVLAQSISNQTLNDSQFHPSESSKSASSTLFSSSKGRVVLSTTNGNGAPAKESFVTKTRRRRAQDAEYYKQVRLAQLEAECELEENVHIRTVREVKARRETENKRRQQQDAVAAALKAQRLREEKTAPAAGIQDESPEVASRTEVLEIESAIVSDNATNDPQHNEGYLNTPAVALKQQPGSRNEISNAAEEETGTATESAKEQRQTEIQVTTQESDAAKQDNSSDARTNMTNQAGSGFESVTEEMKQEEPQKVDSTEQLPAQHEGEIVQQTVEDARDDYEDAENDGEIDAAAETSSNNTKVATVVVKPPVLDDALEISDNEEDDPEEENSVADGELSFDGNPTERDDVIAQNLPPTAPSDEPTSIKTPEPALCDDEEFDEDLENHTEIVISPSEEVATSGNTDGEVAKLQGAVEPARLGYQCGEANSSADKKCRQGFLVDVIDPHTKLVGLELSEETPSEVQDLAKGGQMTMQPGEATIITQEAGPVEENSNDAEHSAEEDTRELHETVKSPPLAAEPETASSVSLEHMAQEEGIEKAMAEDVKSEEQVRDSVVDASRTQVYIADSEADATHDNDAEAKLASNSTPLSASRAPDPVENEQESKLILKQMGLDLADMEEAMEVAAHTIQQFWRQVVVARFPHNLDGVTASETADLNGLTAVGVTPMTNAPDEQPESDEQQQEEEEEEEPQDSYERGEVSGLNSPLYVRTFDEEEDLGFHYIAHVSLDIIEEKLRSASIMAAKDDMYLGFLGPIEDYRVYGYVTNTSIKFVAIMQDSPVRESELRSFFAEMHKMYVNAMSNPFAPIGERITSQNFEKKVYNLVLQHNTASA